MKSNRISHIINTTPTLLPNVYDGNVQGNILVKQKLKETNQTKSQLISKIKYMSLNNWEEYKATSLSEMEFVKKVCSFIDEAAL